MSNYKNNCSRNLDSEPNYSFIGPTSESNRYGREGTNTSRSKLNINNYPHSRLPTNPNLLGKRKREEQVGRTSHIEETGPEVCTAEFLKSSGSSNGQLRSQAVKSLPFPDLDFCYVEVTNYGLPFTNTGKSGNCEEIRPPLERPEGEPEGQIWR